MVAIDKEILLQTGLVMIVIFVLLCLTYLFSRCIDSIDISKMIEKDIQKANKKALKQNEQFK